MLLISSGSGQVAGMTGALSQLLFNAGAVTALEPPLLPLLAAALMY